MTAVLDFPSDDRVAALVQCMQGRARRVSASRYQFSLGFDGLAAGPSAWDTLSLVQRRGGQRAQARPARLRCGHGLAPSWGARDSKSRTQDHVPLISWTPSLAALGVGVRLAGLAPRVD